MSVEVQGRHQHKQFGINSTQFEEIVPKTNQDERSSPSKKEEMKKESDTEGQTDKEEKKQRKKSDSNHSSDDQYEDDFEEIETSSPRKVQQKSKLQGGKTSPKRRSLSRSPEISTVKSSSVLSRRSGKKFKKNYKAYESPRTSSPASSRPDKSWGRPKNRSANAKMSRLDDTVVDRVLSANRHKVQKLESRLSQLIKELTLERNENKTLRQIHHRQEKELMKVNNEEAELPRLLTKHTTEVKSLREGMRRLHETTLQKENKLNEQDKEILKLKDKCKHYKDLCEMKNLTERADLQKKLTQAQDNLEKRDSEISKLQRMVNLKEKAHARHLKEQKDKTHETESRLKQMEENYNYLQDRLKEKEKQLDYTNIYQRQIVLKEKGQSLPESLTMMAALPAPKKTKKPNIIIKNNNNKNNDNKKAAELEVNKKPDSFFLTAHVHSDTGSDKELDKSGDDTVGTKQLSITDRSNVSDIGMTSLNKTIEEMAEQNERLKKEEFERSLHEEEERLKKEKEKLERRKKEDDEREERERVEREAKWREDSAKRAREEQERRQESARRRREEEEQKKLDEEAKEKWKEDSFFDDEKARKKKEQLLARLKAIDNEKATDRDLYNSDDRRSSNGKSDHETMKQANVKLQNGLPPLGKESRIVSPTVSVKSDPDGVFGIPRNNKPVLIGRGGFQKKSTQFSWLDDNNNKKPGGKIVKQNDNFGDYSSVTKKTSGELDGDVFDTGHSRKAGRGRRRDAGPSGENGFNFGERRGSGGFEKPKTQNNLPFLSQDFDSKNKGRSISPSNNEPLLPLRRRAQGKNGPAISSVFDDNLDDDIEELTL